MSNNTINPIEKKKYSTICTQNIGVQKPIKNNKSKNQFTVLSDDLDPKEQIIDKNIKDKIKNNINEKNDNINEKNDNIDEKNDKIDEKNDKIEDLCFSFACESSNFDFEKFKILTIEGSYEKIKTISIQINAYYNALLKAENAKQWHVLTKSNSNIKKNNKLLNNQYISDKENAITKIIKAYITKEIKLIETEIKNNMNTSSDILYKKNLIYIKNTYIGKVNNTEIHLNKQFNTDKTEDGKYNRYFYYFRLYFQQITNEIFNGEVYISIKSTDEENNLELIFTKKKNNDEFIVY